MRSIKFHWLAAISLALAALTSSSLLATPPRYGGTLRVKLRAAGISLDPREWTPGSLAAAENERVAALVYDRMVSLDDYGKFQPALAMEWTHDAAFKNWQFKLRPGVRFSDGSPLTPAQAAAALQATLGKNLEVSANDTSVNIHAIHPAPDLLEQLASGRTFLFRAQLDGTLAGTGPFFVSETTAATANEANPSIIRPAKIKLQANVNCWAGRPFLDFIEITLGEPALRQLMDLQIGKADIVELAPDLVRKGRQEGLRIWNSAPLTFVALRFDDALAAPAADQLREALWLSLDRDTMANVLLQRQAQPAAALLPQWLTGYALLIESPMSLERARELRASLPASEFGATQPLRLHVEPLGDLFKLMGERVAVNARQANLLVQVALPGNSNASSPAASADGLSLFAWHYESLSPQAELDAMLRQMPDGTEVNANAGDPEQLYVQERRLLDERRILPLVLLPDYVGIRTGVRNWNASPWGDWRLADVWLEAEDSSLSKNAIGSIHEISTARTPGAKP